MSSSTAARRPRPGDAATIHEQLPRSRRRWGLALVGVGVLALAGQSAVEWLLPYDPAPLDALRRIGRWPSLSGRQLTWTWALICGGLLLALAASRSALPQRSTLLAAITGVALGSAHAAAGGPAASVAMLLLVGIASLGWHAGRDGGLALLLSTALTVTVWDFQFSDYPSLGLVAAALALTFIWIDRQHIRASDHRLFAALAERDTLITSLDQRSAELTVLQGARTQLLAGISHDLRQPLQAIRLFGEALQGRGLADGRAGEMLRQQMRAADDAVAMLDQFSEISAIEQGVLQSHPELLNLRQLLDDVAANQTASLESPALKLSVHGRPQWVYTDRTQLSRLVQNLVGNAVRYSLGWPAEGPARVVIAVRPHTSADGGEGLVIDVVDNGRGIPADKLDAVFQPYVQLAEGGSGASRGGRGLGLAIVRGLALQLGLQLAPIRSRLGRGTRFRVVLPAALRRASSSLVAVSDSAEGRSAEAATDPARLDGWLLALLDDESAARAALRAALEGAGATLVDAASLDALRTLLADEPRFPDALVFDLDLGPGQPDGVAAVSALRLEWELMVPALIVTGRIAALATLNLPPRCLLLGKPVALATLVQTLRRAVPERR